MKDKLEKRANLFSRMKELNDSAKDGMSAEQESEWNKLNSEIDAIDAEIEGEKRSSEQKAAREARLAKIEKDLSQPVNGRKEDLGQPGRKEDRGQDKAKEEYRSAFRNYLKGGLMSLKAEERELLEQRALSAGSNVDGGYLIPPEETVMEIIKTVDDAVFMRGLARIKQIAKAASIGIPTRTARASDAEWTSELATGAQDSALAYGKRVMVPHKLSKKIKISKQLIFQSPFGVESEVNQELGYVFGITQEKAFLTGSGAGQPLGVFVASADGISTGRDVTASATTAFSADDLINVVYNLKSQYQAKASWLVSREFVKRCRKLKDGEGQYLWQMGLQAGQPDRLLNKPLYMSEFAPSTFTTGLYVGLLGAFDEGYLILDALEMQMQRLVELYAESGQIGFIADCYCDGAPVKEEAFSRLILA